MTDYEPNPYRTRDIPIEGDYANYDINWRSNELATIYRQITRREHVSIVGVGTVGKTHFLKRIIAPDILNAGLRYHGADLRADDFLFVTVDPNALVDIGEAGDSQRNVRAWSGFELILHDLLDTCYRAGIDPLVVEGMKQDYAGLTSSRQLNREMGFRLLQSAVARILDVAQPPVKRIVIVFDEFELLYRKMPASFFINLRALRDRYRYQLLFLTLSRVELYNLPYTFADDDERRDATRKLAEAETYFETFKNPVYLGPTLFEGDTIELVRNLNARVRQGQRLIWPHYNLLHNYLGGHAGLLRTGLLILDDLLRRQHVASQLGETFAQHLLQNRDIQHECEIMLRSCIPEERTILASLAERQNGLTPAEQAEVAARTLYNKGLISHIDGQNGRGISPEIFKMYMSNRVFFESSRSPYQTPANPRPEGPNITMPQPPDIGRAPGNG